MLLGVDVGGTFTDAVLVAGHRIWTAKAPCTPHDQAAGRLDATGAELVPLDPTALDALAQRLLDERVDAVAVCLLHADLSDLHERTVAAARAARGLDVTRSSELSPLGAIPDVGDVDAVAVCLLHADLSDAHERAVGGVLRDRGFDVTCSSEIAPEMREYERTVTTVVNAYLRPRCRSYLHGLAGVAGEVLVMTSAGGLVPIERGAEVPAALLLSGPAGGVRAGAAIARACGFPDAVTFDMGGTSTDVCLVLDGRPAPAAQREVAGLPVRLPSLDIHTIGAGGGSIARVDAGGALRVGPRSAGAVPGPA
jgi:N-methylhydantoinase A/oxoprolinase/acetone carboxylase beta subunit